MLEVVARHLARRPLLVTWNGLGFDAPVIAWRAARLGVPIVDLWRRPGRLRSDGYLDRGAARHLDLGLAFGGGRMPRLDEACAAIGLPGKADDAAGAVSGADTVELVLQGGWARLARYVLRDAHQAYAIFLAHACASGRCTVQGYKEALCNWADELASATDSGEHDDLVAYARRRAAALVPPAVPPEPHSEPRLRGYA
jgi:predicted PolB exonuclease-like 3'-5' exonuclease